MFNFLKRKSLISDWNLNINDEFKEIINDDSIQYIDENKERYIYLSILIVNKNIHEPTYINHLLNPEIIKNDGSFILEGIKIINNKILVVRINFNNESDIDWAKNFFNEISPKE